jgi:hypothetical protein
MVRATALVSLGHIGSLNLRHYELARLPSVGLAKRLASDVQLQGGSALG